MRGTAVRIHQLQQAGPGGLAFRQLKAGAGAYFARDSDRGPLVGDNDDVAILETDGRHAAFTDEGIQVHRRHDLIVAADLDVPVAAPSGVDPARLVQIAQQGIGRGTAVAAGLGHIAGDEQGDGLRIHGGQIDLAVGMAGGRQLAAQGILQFVLGQTGHVELADFGDVQLAGRADFEDGIHIEAPAPQAQDDPVTRCDGAGGSSLTEIALEKIGSVGCRSVSGIAALRQEQQAQQQKKNRLFHGTAPGLVLGLFRLGSRHDSGTHALAPDAGRQPPLALGIAAGNDDLGFIEIVADSGALAFFTSRGEEAVFHAHAHVRPEGGIGKGGDVTGHGIGHKIFHRAGLVFGRFRGVSQQAAAIEGQTGRQHEKGRETFHEFSWEGKAGIGPLLVSPGQADARDLASGVKRAGEAPDR